MEKIKIREYQNLDKDSVYSLILSIMEEEFENIPSHLYLQDIGDVPGVYGGEKDCFYICEYENKIIGTIALKQDDDDSALIRRFFVSPNFRALGVGGKLIAKVLEFCKKQKYSKVLFDGNTKMHKVRYLLKKHGFKEEEFISSPEIGIFKLSYVLSYP